jgi:hypothetical protein
MYRVYFPKLDMDMQNEDKDILNSIIAEIRAGRYAFQEYGWVEIEDENKPQVSHASMEDMYGGPSERDYPRRT